MNQIAAPSSAVIFENALELERYVAALYYAAGYQVFLQGGGFRSGEGVDLVVIYHGVVTVIQCQHGDVKTAVRDVRELLGAMVDFRARRAGFIATAGFTDAAVRFALRNKMELIDGQALATTIERFYGWTPFHEAFDYFRKRCPRCGGNLVNRETAPSRELAWVCCHYPQCHHTEPFDSSRVVELPLEKAS